MAVIIARYEALFLNDNSDRSQWAGQQICSEHLKELSRQFYGAKYYHLRKKGGRTICGFPEKGHTNKAVLGLELTYSQSKYLLENRHFLLLPGTRKIYMHNAFEMKEKKETFFQLCAGNITTR